MTAPVAIAAFYRFVSIDDRNGLRDSLVSQTRAHDLQGSILIAEEGINGTVAGRPAALEEFLACLMRDARFADLPIRRSFAPDLPFKRMKVRLKNEIVTLRHPVDPIDGGGTRVAPDAWNDLISDPDVLVIDTRNDEEVRLGSFTNAVNPQTESFGEFVAFVDGLDPKDHPTVAMFCTGGIRCEKASALMKDRGFADVRQLDGGILHYLEAVSPAESRWHGECFVFDERVTVDHDLAPGSYTLCRGCRRALSEADRNHPDFEEGVSCERCRAEMTPLDEARRRERHFQEQLAAGRGTKHVGRES